MLPVRKETATISPFRESSKKGREKTGQFIDGVAEVLGDGRWHYVHELSRRLNKPERMVREVLRFFADFNITVLSRTGDKAKLNWRSMTYLA